MRSEEIAALVRRRMAEEILYELQTGGGMSLGATSPTAGQQRLLAEIRAIVDQLTAIFRRAPARAAALLPSGPLRVLDVGAGKAPWSLAIAERHAQTRVTAVDLPDQVAVLDTAVRSRGFADRVEVVAADVLAPGWDPGGRFHLVVIANVCHLFSARRNRELLRRVVPVVRPGGTLAIIDQVLDEVPDWPRWSALYMLGVLHGAPGGRLFPVRVYGEWLAELVDWELAVHALCPLPPLTLIAARRRT